MAFAEINLRVIFVLLPSDWLAKNLELEPLIPGRSPLTNFSFPLPTNFRMRIHISGKIRLARETSVRACLCLCFLARNKIRIHGATDTEKSVTKVFFSVTMFLSHVNVAL